MNDQTLKDLFRGNLSPENRQMVRGSDAARAVTEMSNAENLLSQALPPDLMPFLERLIRAQGQLETAMAETYYIDGFKTGARVMLEIMDDAHDNLEPIKE